MGGISIWQLIIIVSVLLIYFLPSIIAVKKDHKNMASILLINMFLGWSLIGWLVAIVWAIKKTESVVIATSNVSNADELEKLHNLKEKGILSEEEFEKQKVNLIG